MLKGRQICNGQLIIELYSVINCMQQSTIPFPEMITLATWDSDFPAANGIPKWQSGRRASNRPTYICMWNCFFHNFNPPLTLRPPWRRTKSRPCRLDHGLHFAIPVLHHHWSLIMYHFWPFCKNIIIASIACIILSDFWLVIFSILFTKLLHLLIINNNPT
jgi:hypothetical protein